MLFVALALAFVACEKAPVEEPKPDPQPEVELQITSENPIAVAAEGGEVVITYTLSAESDTLPEASCEAEWITDIAVAEGTITLNVAANEAEESRTATLVVTFNTKSYDVEITQAAKVVDEPKVVTYAMATAERDATITGNVYSIVFVSEDGKTRLIANITGREGDMILNSGTYSLNLAKSLFKTESGIVELASGETEVEYLGTDDVPPTTLDYTFEFSLVGDNDAQYKVTYKGEVAGMYQEPEPVEPEAFVPAKVVAVKSMIGNFFLQFYIDGTRYHELDLLDEIAPNDKYLSQGVYKYSDNTIGHNNSTFNVAGDQTCALEDAELTLSHNEEEGTSTIVGYIKSAEGHHITIDWMGVVEGFDFEPEVEIPVDPNAIVVEITSAKVNYDKAGEKQILFTAGDQQHQFNFTHEEIVVSKPIPNGTYSLADGTMNERYCLHDYGWTDGSMSDIVVQIRNTSENTTRFVASWVYSSQTYTFDWTGVVEGYTYEDVSGQKLDFTPTYVEVSDAGYAGLYFYFYDDKENELVFNYDRETVYMPYINYEGTKLDIDTADYTFEYTDNGDGTYTYNARFVTADGRTIEFAGALPTTIS